MVYLGGSWPIVLGYLAFQVSIILVLEALSRNPDGATPGSGLLTWDRAVKWDSFGVPKARGKSKALVIWQGTILCWVRTH